MPKIISHTPKPVRTKLSALDKDHIIITLTCQSGLESLVRRECEKIGLTHMTGQDRLVSGRGTLRNLYEVLVWSRFSNRAYIEILTEKMTDFDSLHDTLAQIAWSDYLSGKEYIVIEASSTRSVLAHTPTIQAVGQKAIFSTLYTPNNAHATEVHILILIVDDIAHIMLDVTGDPLHKRGYRDATGEAPIKENLAAALVAFSRWKYGEPFLDPFCGSGTLAIEAAMMARNIAPGLTRHFRLEGLPFHDRGLLEETRNLARMKSYPSGEYKIYASDIDPEIVRIAKRNAELANVGDDIEFSVSDALDALGRDMHDRQRDSDGEKNPQPLHSSSTAPLQRSSAIIVTNPPYGNRLQSEDLREIYTALIHEVEVSGGGFITSYGVDVRHGLANKKLLNGADECRFWYKK